MAKPILRTVCFEHNGKKYSKNVYQTKKGNSKPELATDEELIASLKATLDRVEKLKQKKNNRYNK